MILFAEGSAAKEQWFVALRRAAAGERKTELGALVEGLYARFCTALRADAAECYPQVLRLLLLWAAFTLQLCFLGSFPEFCWLHEYQIRIV